MIDPFQVAATERGVVRVFTTDLDAEGNAAITAENVQRLLGERLDLDSSRVEVFPSTVMAEMGLSNYLIEGYGVPAEDLEGTSAKLDSLKGLVILVASSAFKGQSVTLSPTDGIRFVGAFQEPGMAPPTSMAAPESAEGALQPTGSSRPLETRPGSFWPIALIALLGAAVLVFVLAL